MRSFPKERPNSYVESLRNALCTHPLAVSAMAAALWSRVHRVIGVGDLEWATGLGIPNAPNLLWNALKEAAAIDTEGHLTPRGLHDFIGMLLAAPANSLPEPKTEVIVWTLPSSHPAKSLRGHSLLGCLLSIIASAQQEILMLFPFMESRGVGLIMEELRRALARGVRLVTIAHNLSEPVTAESRAIEPLRKEAVALLGSFDVYSAVTPPDAVRSDHPLLHAKVVIADRREALVGSANLTIYGLTTNLEVGACIVGSAVEPLYVMILDLLRSPLVSHVFGSTPRARVP